MLKGCGTTTQMLQEVLHLIPSTGSIPILIVGINTNLLQMLMELLGGMALDAGYNVKAQGRYDFLIDNEARVGFKLLTNLHRLLGLYFVDMFIDHYTYENLPFDKRLEFLKPSDSGLPIMNLPWQL